MEIVFDKVALDDFEFWKKSGNKVIQKKITDLFQSMKKSPFGGIGKPETLKYDLSGKWSRRINEEHRIIYSVNKEANIILILSLKGHY